MSNIKSHEQIILGNAVQTILAYDNFIPRVSEYQFERDVLQLLQNPFSKENLARYQPYVMELTRPLNVVESTNPDNVLFQVPALMMSPITTIPTGNGITAENFLHSLKRDYELGGKRVNDKIADFMTRITVIPDVRVKVIQPLRQILQRYGRDFDVPGLKVDQPVAMGGGHQPSSNSFSDDYED